MDQQRGQERVCFKRGQIMSKAEMIAIKARRKVVENVRAECATF